jgi:hypothetical protein
MSTQSPFASITLGVNIADNTCAPDLVAAHWSPSWAADHRKHRDFFPFLSLVATFRGFQIFVSSQEMENCMGTMAASPTQVKNVTLIFGSQPLSGWRLPTDRALVDHYHHHLYVRLHL